MLKDSFNNENFYKDLFECMNILFKTREKDFPKSPSDYQVNNVSNKVVRIIQSYISFVDKNTWKKNQD